MKTTEEKATIRNCPFCGGPASLSRSASNSTVYIFMECDMCGCRTRSFTDANLESLEKNFEDTVAGGKAIRLWNKRACCDE